MSLFKLQWPMKIIGAYVPKTRVISGREVVCGGYIEYRFDVGRKLDPGNYEIEKIDETHFILRYFQTADSILTEGISD